MKKLHLTPDQRAKRNRIISAAIRKYYPKEGRESVQKVLNQKGISLTLVAIEKRADRLRVKFEKRQMQSKKVREVIVARYEELGPEGTQQYLREEHGIKVSVTTIRDIASRMKLSYKKAKEKEDEKPLELPHRHWDEHRVIAIPKERWDIPGKRIAYVSGGSYRVSGYRKGLYHLLGEILATEGCHTIVYAGGIISKKWMQDEIKRYREDTGASRDHMPAIISHVQQEVVEALRSTLPELKDPKGTPIRWQIMASVPVDGEAPYGEEVIRLLKEKRPHDIVRYRTGGDLIEVFQPKGEPRIWHGAVLPKRSRLRSTYMSAGPELDIKDVQEQTHREYPNMWVHGTSATLLYKPSGERRVPYVTLPAMARLERDKKIAENQEGMTILEHKPDGDFLVHSWSFRDAIADERECIEGMREGMTELQRKIVEIIIRDGSPDALRLAEKLRISPEKLQKAIAPLMDEQHTRRKQGPSLQYDRAGERYSFHHDWIQEILRYRLPNEKSGWQEDSFLFFGCLHAGYTTTDYEFVVKKFPEYILRYDIQVLAGVGDFVAGLAHSMMHRGEIMGSMNYTDQEKMAGEIIATVLYNVFTVRFEKEMERFKEETPTREDIEKAVRNSLMLYLIKRGNHDTWTHRDGVTSLVIMHNTLLLLLYKQLRAYLERFLQRYIDEYLERVNFIPADVMKILEEKIVVVPEVRPVYTLTSGINVGLEHPYQARAQTTSLRLEKSMDYFQEWKCQVVGLANFHTAIMARKWTPDIGECVGMQMGTEVIHTDFEAHQMKRIDFGPLYLRTLSYKGRIYKTTWSAFNQPRILEAPRPKWTDVDKLKHDLGFLGYV